MEKSNVKLIAFDLDGTLTQHKTMLKKDNRELLEELKKKYKLVIIGAGACKRIYDQLDGFDIDIVGNYGLEESRVEDGKFVLIRSEKYDVDKEFFENAVSMLRNKYGYQKYDGDNVEFHASGAVTFPLLGTAADKQAKLAFDPGGVKRRRIYKDVAQTFKDFNVFVGGTSSFDITLGKYNKYEALKRYAEEKGISLEDTVYVGDDFEDGGNDSQVRLGGVRYIDVRDYRKLREYFEKEGLL